MAIDGSASPRRRSIAAASDSTSVPWLRVPVSVSRRAASTSAAVWRVIRACAARKIRNSTAAATSAAAQVTRRMSVRMASSRSRIGVASRHSATTPRVAPSAIKGNASRMVRSAPMSPAAPAGWSRSTNDAAA